MTPFPRARLRQAASIAVLIQVLLVGTVYLSWDHLDPHSGDVWPAVLFVVLVAGEPGAVLVSLLAPHVSLGLAVAAGLVVNVIAWTALAYAFASLVAYTRRERAARLGGGAA